MQARGKMAMGVDPGGGEVRIVTRDAAAVTAVHQFLAFQRTEHHVH